MRARVGCIFSVVLAACSGGGGDPGDRPDATTLPDAPLPVIDAGPPADASPLPAPMTIPCPETGEAAVIAINPDGSPRAGQPVVFHDADGSVLVETATGADGRALAFIPAGGQATTPYSYASGVDEFPMLLTWADLAETACVRLRFPHPEFFTVGHATVTLPGTVPGPQNYGVEVVSGGNCFGGASDSALPAEITIWADCVADNDSISVLSVAGDPFNPTAFSWAIDLPYSGGQIDVSLPAWRSDWQSWATTAVNSSSRTLLTQIAAWGTHRDRFILGSAWQQAELAPDSSMNLDGVYPAFDAADGVLIQIEMWDLADNSGMSYYRRKPVGGLDTGVDSSGLLAPVDSISVDDPDAARPVISWVSPAGADTDDLVHVAYFSGPGGIEHDWVVLAAPGRESVQLPALPPTWSAWLPPAGAMRTAWIFRAEGSTTAGYAEAVSREVRANVIVFNAWWLLLPPRSSDVSIQVSAKGRSF